MITNERQFKIAKAEAEKLREALQSFNELDLIKQGIDPIIAGAQRNALSESLADLQRDLARYEELRSGTITELSSTSLIEIGDKLIEARIAHGLSQRELGERLRMKEQQIQRYEHERYATANLLRLNAVAEALNVHVDVKVTLRKVEHAQNNIALSHHLTFNPKKLPIKEMKRRGWFTDIQRDKPTADDSTLAAAFVAETTSRSHMSALHKQQIRSNGKLDEYALLAWKARILQKAKHQLGDARPKSTLDGVAVQELAHLSEQKDGPVLAVKLLREKGIVVVFEEHLPRTHLDGAAMLLEDTTPVIGLTLRLGRVDNFWFVLMHEVAHVFCHRDKGLRFGFFDEEIADSADSLEMQADDFARNAFIPDEMWKSSFVRFAKSEAQVIEFAKHRKISAAIVAGRIRRERDDYTIFNDLLGQDEVRKLLAARGLLEN